MDRNEFFAELDQLTPAEIEARISSWGREELALVQEYIATNKKSPQGLLSHVERTAWTRL